MTTRGQPLKLPSTTLSLAALAVGVAVGALFKWADRPALDFAATCIEPIGQMWMRALMFIVVPLVITQLLVVVAGRAKSVGVLGAWSVALFVALLIGGAVFSGTLAPVLIAVTPIDLASIVSMPVEIPEMALQAAERAQSVTFDQWIIGLVPSNFFAALAEGAFLQIILGTVLFGFAVTRLPAKQHERLLELFEALADATMIIVRWLLWLTPAAVFALAMHFTRRMEGMDAAIVLVAFMVLVSLLLVGYNIALYPIAVIGGGVPLKAFAKSVYPAQVVAASTRSSLATLPALIDGAERHLTIPRQVYGFALPFSASTFKVNRTVSSTAELLFLGHVYGVPLSVPTVITFVVTVIILSFSAVGIPRGGSAFKTLPAYMAAGIPIEGVVLLEVIKDIPDIFKTIINSTGYMTVAVLLSRIMGRTFEEAKPDIVAPAPIEVEA